VEVASKREDAERYLTTDLKVDHWYNFYLKEGHDPITLAKDGVWKMAIHAAKVVRIAPDKSVEVTYPAKGSEHLGILAARAADAVNGAAPKESGPEFQKWEKSITEWATRTIPLNEIERITSIDGEPSRR